MIFKDTNNLTPILRGFVSLLLILLLSALVMAAKIAILSLVDKPSDYMTFGILFLGVPTVFLCSIASLDTKKIRLKVALKSLGITYLLYFIWHSTFLQPIRELAFGIDQIESIRAVVIPELIVTFVLMSLSTFLAVKWMPSWNIVKKDTSTPLIVEKSRKLFNFSIIATAFLSIIYAYTYSPVGHSSLDSGVFYPEFMQDVINISSYGVLLFAIALLYIVREIANNGNYAWRNIVLSFYLFTSTITIMSWIFSTEEMIRSTFSQPVFSVFLTITTNTLFMLQVYAVYLLYTKQSKEWFEATKQN